MPPSPLRHGAVNEEMAAESDSERGVQSPPHSPSVPSESEDTTPVQSATRTAWRKARLAPSVPRKASAKVSVPGGRGSVGGCNSATLVTPLCTLLT